mgnify:CR=1 FL=1
MSIFDRFLPQAPSETPPPSGGIRLVVGLGNPGEQYDQTRHNIGFELVDRIAVAEALKWARERKFRAKIAKQSASLILCKPLTYMNLSGNSVARIARFHRLKPEQILIAYDDVDLPLGRLRFRAEGSAGGHNGIKSIIEYLGTKQFPRLKIGVGKAQGSHDMVDHVLGRFTDEESPEVEKVLAIAQDGVSCALSAGLDAAMNAFNNRS